VQVWVTGATGQIGRKLCVELKCAGHEVTAFSRGRVDNPSDYQWVHWDMSEKSFDYQNLATPDVVFHLAAQTSAFHACENLHADVGRTPCSESGPETGVTSPGKSNGVLPADQKSAYQARKNFPGDVTTNVLGFVKLPVA